MLKVLILLLIVISLVTIIRKIIKHFRLVKYNKDKYDVSSLTDTQLQFMIGTKKTIFCCDLTSDFYFILVPYTQVMSKIKSMYNLQDNENDYYLMVESNNMSLTKCDDLYSTLSKIRKDLTNLRFYSTENFSRLYHYYRGIKLSE